MAGIIPIISAKFRNSRNNFGLINFGKFIFNCLNFRLQKSFGLGLNYLISASNLTSANKEVNLIAKLSLNVFINKLIFVHLEMCSESGQSGFPVNHPKI